MRRWFGFGFLILLVALPVVGQEPLESKLSDAEVKELILFNEIVQACPEGRALDVSFAQGGFEVIQGSSIVWTLDPTAPGLWATASRPIRETAKAGEKMGQRGGDAVREGVALHVRAGQEGAYVLTAGGSLLTLTAGGVDSVRVASTFASSIDLDANLSGVVAVLWGREVALYASPPAAPLWRITLEEDLLPAVGIAMGAAGEVYVAGRGAVALAVYDLAAEGEYRRARTVAKADLGLQAVAGMELTPYMLLPQEGREGWVDQDRFVILGDGETGTLVALKRRDLQPLGRWDVHGQLSTAALGRLDVSNRGQIAFVDSRTGAASVLPASVMLAMVEPDVPRWRNLEPKREFRVQGGDTLNLDEPER